MIQWLNGWFRRLYGSIYIWSFLYSFWATAKWTFMVLNHTITKQMTLTRKLDYLLGLAAQYKVLGIDGLTWNLEVDDNPLAPLGYAKLLWHALSEIWKAKCTRKKIVETIKHNVFCQLLNNTTNMNSTLKHTVWVVRHLSSWFCMSPLSLLPLTICLDSQPRCFKIWIYCLLRG